jgi:hypothetical protein
MKIILLPSSSFSTPTLTIKKLQGVKGLKETKGMQDPKVLQGVKGLQALITLKKAMDFFIYRET